MCYWVTQLPGCSGQNSWLDRAGDTLSNRWGYELVSLPWSGGRTHSKAKDVLCLGSWIRQSCVLNFIARWSHCLGLADGHTHWLGFLLESPASRNFICQDPSTGCCKPHSPSPLLFDLQLSSPTDFSLNLCEKRTKWVTPGGAGCSPWAIFHSLEKPGIPLYAVLCQPGGGALWSVCSCPSYPFNVVFLGL